MMGKFELADSDSRQYIWQDLTEFGEIFANFRHYPAFSLPFSRPPMPTEPIATH